MPVSPLTDADGPVALEIRSNGARIPDSAQVVSVRTRAEMMRIPEAEIVLLDGDPASGEFPLADGALFVPGGEIEVAAGYGDANVRTIFKGVVVGLRLQIDDGAPRLTVSCADKAVKLTVGRRGAVSADTKDSDAISALASAAGLSATVDATAAAHPGLVQYRASDWDFIVARAEVNGLLAWAEAGALSVRKPDHAAAAALRVTCGLDLLGFDGAIDAASQLRSVEVTAWDPASQATVKGTAGPAAEGAWGNLTGAALGAVAAPASFGIESAAALTAADLEGAAKARQARAELARLTGRVRFQGSALARLGATLELAGLGARFNGKGLICGVRHRIDDGAWETEAGLGMDARWLAERRGDEPGAAGLTLPARGLQIGKVAKLTDDPAAENRVQVKLPLVGADAAVWARLGGPYCSNGAGLMFLPEIDDEVVVAFLNDDPGHAVVLGSLHSSKSPPPVAPDAKNHVKTIVTPAKLRLELDDEQRKVTVATPGGNTVVLDDAGKTVTLADQNGNALTLSGAGITLDSAGDVTIKAKKAVAVQATADVALKGMNVTATGQTSFSASGNASAEVKAAGTVKVQGALVQIN